MVKTTIYLPHHPRCAKSPFHIYLHYAAQTRLFSIEFFLEEIHGAGASACHLGREVGRDGLREASTFLRPVFRSCDSDSSNRAFVLLWCGKPVTTVEIKRKPDEMHVFPQRIYTLLYTLRIFGKSPGRLRTVAEFLQESKLVHVVQVAAGPDSANLEQWVPLRIRLSTELMWDILGLSFATSPSSVQVPGFFDDSMQPPTTLPSEQPSSIFEIAAATSPDITLQDSDGGQAAPVPSTSIYPISREDEAFDRQNNTVVIQNETLGDNPSWLWQHHSQVSGQQNVARQHLHESAIGDGWDAPWWEFGRF